MEKTPTIFQSLGQIIVMYAIVDIETTGGYANFHRITEVAVFHHDGARVTGEFRTLINPGRDIPYFITGLTGIHAEMVKDAPTFNEVAGEILSWLNDRIFVAHNAQFDYGFLKKEFEDAGINWNSKKLCTVRLCRKFFPGLKSYSLGRLAESLGIPINERHRARGDAEATAKIFDLLIRRDTEGEILRTLKKNSGETILPPNLLKENFEKLPAMTGVYYFHDAKGKVIYVGKALNIRKRITGHFSGDARGWSRSNIRNEIHNISFELTGSELIALILEAQEIHRLWPKYNLAQKNKVEEWGIFDYEDQAGFLRFSMNVIKRGSKPLISFTSKGDIWNLMWEIMKTFTLCPKLSGLQKTTGTCHEFTSGGCRGACAGKEAPQHYNQRAKEAIRSMVENNETLAIVDRGRIQKERSIVLVEKGKYIGYGFAGKRDSIASYKDALNLIKPGKENRVIQNLINSFLLNPGEAKIIQF